MDFSAEKSQKIRARANARGRMERGLSWGRGGDGIKWHGAARTNTRPSPLSQLRSITDLSQLCSRFALPAPWRGQAGLPLSHSTLIGSPFPLSLSCLSRFSTAVSVRFCRSSRYGDGKRDRRGREIEIWG